MRSKSSSRGTVSTKGSTGTGGASGGECRCHQGSVRPVSSGTSSARRTRCRPPPVRRRSADSGSSAASQRCSSPSSIRSRRAISRARRSGSISGSRKMGCVSARRKNPVPPTSIGTRPRARISSILLPRVARPPPRAEPLRRLHQVDPPVRHLRPLLRRRLGRPHVHPAEHRARVHGDDLAVQTPRDLDRQRGLAGAGGAEQRERRGRHHAELTGPCAPAAPSAPPPGLAKLAHPPPKQPGGGLTMPVQVLRGRGDRILPPPTQFVGGGPGRGAVARGLHRGPHPLLPNRRCSSAIESWITVGRPWMSW
jgi:hypothetical protein